MKSAASCLVSEDGKARALSNTPLSDKVRLYFKMVAHTVSAQCMIILKNHFLYAVFDSIHNW